MYPWRRILIPTDFSTASEWVFDDAVRLAGTTGAEIVILHIRMTRPSHPGELRFPADPSLYDYVEKVELEKMRDRVRRANATVPTRLLVRTAPEAGSEICKTASDEQADLIVMATHARHHVAHLLVGGTTQQVLTDPTSPVLAIRYGIRRRPAFRKIVVPLQGGETVSTALDLAGQIAAREKSEIHMLTICAAAERQKAIEGLASLAAERLAGIASTRTVIVSDHVEREIGKYTEKSAADALFISTHKPGPLSLDIIRNASVPVMVVPGA